MVKGQQEGLFKKQFYGAVTHYNVKVVVRWQGLKRALKVMKRDLTIFWWCMRSIFGIVNQTSTLCYYSGVIPPKHLKKIFTLSVQKSTVLFLEFKKKYSSYFHIYSFSCSSLTHVEHNNKSNMRLGIISSFSYLLSIGSCVSYLMSLISTPSENRVVIPP